MRGLRLGPNRTRLVQLTLKPVCDSTKSQIRSCVIFNYYELLHKQGLLSKSVSL